MLVYHIATRADWQSARRPGRYPAATAEHPPAGEDTVLAVRREQVPRVFGRSHRDTAEPLVLLTIDTSRVSSWTEERVGTESFWHLQAPVDLAAVVSVSPLTRRGGTESFTSLFVKEMLGRIALALLVMACMSLGVPVARRWLDGDWAGLIGAGAGLAVGVVLVGAVVFARRRRGLSR